MQKKGALIPFPLFLSSPPLSTSAARATKIDEKEGRQGPKKLFGARPPYLSIWMTAPPPPYLEVWIRHWEIHRGADLRHLHISQVPPYLPPKILHNLCFSFLLQVACITKLKLKKILFDIVRLQAVNFIPALLLAGN